MDIKKFEAGSPAFEELRRALADPNTYQIALEFRAWGVAVKTNQLGWTPALRMTASRPRA